MHILHLATFKVYFSVILVPSEGEENDYDDAYDDEEDDSPVDDARSKKLLFKQLSAAESRTCGILYEDSSL